MRSLCVAYLATFCYPCVAEDSKDSETGLECRGHETATQELPHKQQLGARRRHSNPFLHYEGTAPGVRMGPLMSSLKVLHMFVFLF